MSTGLAVLILTRNEEHNLADCIRSADGAGEIVVVDSGSTDGTQTIAESMGVYFTVHEMGADGFAGQRNFALTQTEAEWVFFLDADERLSPAGVQELRQISEHGEPAVYAVQRRNVIFGQRMSYGAHAPDWTYRLMPRQGGTWQGLVHESFQSSLPRRYLRESMEHYTYRDWHSYLRKFDEYTTLGAKKMYQAGSRAGLNQLFLHPAFAFVKMYFLKQGFRDGHLGFVMSVWAALAVWIKYLKLWQLGHCIGEEKG